MNRAVRIALVLASVAFAVPGCSGGSSTLDPQPKKQTWHVQAGAASPGLAYYPAATLPTGRGDTVTWTFPAGEPHTVSLVPAGQALPSPANPANSHPAGGKTFDGSTFTSSGF